MWTRLTWFRRKHVCGFLWAGRWTYGVEQMWGVSLQAGELLTSEEWLCSAELSSSDVGGDSCHSTNRPVYYLLAFGLHVFIHRNVICAMCAKIPVTRSSRRLKFCTVKVKVNVNQSRYRPGVAHRVPGSSGSQISWHRHREGGKVVSLTHWPHLPPRNSFDTLMLEAESTPCP